MIRGPFTGVANIVRFNWPMYAGAVAVIGTGLVITRLAALPRLLARMIMTGLFGAAFTIFSSLVVSFWIYDRSPLYGWKWLGKFVSRPPRRIVNVHAGFDESTAALRRLYPEAEMAVLDFYDPVKNPEASIARARAASEPDPATIRIAVDHWPLPDASADLVVLFLVAHEVRDRTDRAAMFKEIRRICALDARVVLVEHLRDMANFAAFGPGFLHFLSYDDWREAARNGFQLAAEEKVTPFVHLFCFTPR